MSDSPCRVGFIGLGIMGVPMAGHLLKAGHALYVYSRTRRKGDQLCADGAVWCDSPADVARQCEILITIVTDTADVEEVLFGTEGAAANLAAGALVVDMSTIAPRAAQDFARRFAERNIAMLDAPVTGGDVGARNATLTIMVGGEAAAFERARPLLERLGRNIVHVGPSGAGQMLKACNQILCAVNQIGVSEALTLARASGLDPEILLSTLASGAGGSWALSNLGRRGVDGDLNPAFMVRLIQKDLRNVQDFAQSLAVPLPGTALAQQLFRAVEAEPGGAGLGTQAMIKVYDKLAARDSAD